MGEYFNDEHYVILHNILKYSSDINGVLTFHFDLTLDAVPLLENVVTARKRFRSVKIAINLELLYTSLDMW